MTKKEKCKPEKCVICGRPTCHIIGIHFKPVPICPSCCALITKQFVPRLVEAGLEEIIKEDERLQEGLEDAP